MAVKKKNGLYRRALEAEGALPPEPDDDEDEDEGADDGEFDDLDLDDLDDDLADEPQPQPRRRVASAKPAAAAPARQSLDDDWDDDDSGDDSAGDEDDGDDARFLTQSLAAESRSNRGSVPDPNAKKGVRWLCTPCKVGGEKMAAEAFVLYGDKNKGELYRGCRAQGLPYPAYECHRIEAAPGPLRAGKPTTKDRSTKIEYIDLSQLPPTRDEDDEHGNVTLPDEVDDEMGELFSDDIGSDDDLDIGGLIGAKDPADEHGPPGRGGNGNGSGSGADLGLVIALDRIAKAQRESSRELFAFLREERRQVVPSSGNGNLAATIKEIAEACAPFAPLFANLFQPRNHGEEMVNLIKMGFDLKGNADKPSTMTSVMQGVAMAGTMLAGMRDPAIMDRFIGPSGAVATEAAVVASTPAPAANPPRALPKTEPERRALPSPNGDMKQQPQPARLSGFQEHLWLPLANNIEAIGNLEAPAESIGEQFWARQIMRRWPAADRNRLISTDVGKLFDEAWATPGLVEKFTANLQGEPAEREQQAREMLTQWIAGVTESLRNEIAVATAAAAGGGQQP